MLTSDQEFRDTSTGLPLNSEMVKKVRELEIQYMEELKVLEDSDRDVCMAETGRPPISTDINKGDSLRSNYRSRLVCQETRGRSTIDVEDWAATFAATPPYEAFKLQLSFMMTGPRSQIEGDDDVRGHFQSTSPLTACESCVRGPLMAMSTSC